MQRHEEVVKGFARVLSKMLEVTLFYQFVNLSVNVTCSDLSRFSTTEVKLKYCPLGK